jgi:hypothetical protein
MLVDDTLHPLLIVSVNPALYRHIPTADLFCPLRGIRLFSAYHE